MVSVHHTMLHQYRFNGWAVRLILLLIVCAPLPAFAQSACAPDASGDFKPTASVICQVPANGEFSYRDVVIPAFITVSFQRNAKNTPVTIRSSGNVTISGRIVVSGASASGRLGGKGGPGGFDGGRGGSFLDTLAGATGDGPGGGGGTTLVTAGGGGGSFGTAGDGGSTPNGVAGITYGASTLLPLIGGSGGGGGGAGAAQGIAGGGGGGGGAILIFCAGSIKFDYTGDTSYGIYADGGNGTCPAGSAAYGGGGSGGAIRLVANSITNTVARQPVLSVDGGGFTCITNGTRYAGGLGYIRVEARDLSTFTPNASRTISTSLTLGPATLTNAPQLKILSVAGQAAPASPIGSFYQQPDITVPTSVTNPVTVAVQGTNLPANTTVQVMLTKESGEKETKTCALSNGSCNVSLTLPTSGVAVITASATLDVLIALGRPLMIEGERVGKVEIAAAFGGRSEVTYITESGRRFKQNME